MVGQNGIVRFFGGNQHWSKSRTPNGDYPPSIIFSVPQEFNVARISKVENNIFTPTFDTEEYIKQRILACSWTRMFNRIHKEFIFYVLRGYKLVGNDLSVAITDFHHDIEWGFDKTRGQWWWSLDEHEFKCAIAERVAVKDGFMDIVPKLFEHGPAWSEEFERSVEKI